MEFLSALAVLNGQKVVDAIRKGLGLKVTVDNIDGRKIANQVHASFCCPSKVPPGDGRLHLWCPQKTSVRYCVIAIYICLDLDITND